MAEDSGICSIDFWVRGVSGWKKTATRFEFNESQTSFDWVSEHAKKY